MSATVCLSVTNIKQERDALQGRRETMDHKVLVLMLMIQSLSVTKLEFNSQTESETQTHLLNNSYDSNSTPP